MKWPCFYGIDTGDRTELLASVAHRRRDPRLPQRRHPRLRQPRPARGGHRRAGRRVLRRLLHRRLPGRGPGHAAQARPRGAGRAARRARPSRRRSTEATAPWARATRTPASTSPPARRRSSASRRRSARRSGPRSSATSAASAGCSRSPATATRHPVLVSSTDGVGTKALIAQATGRFDTIGVDLVAMCVDDIVCQGAEPLFFLDYIAVGKLDPDHIEQLVEGVAEGCRQAGLRADRRRDGRAPRRHGAGRVRPRRLRGRRRRARPPHHRRARAARATCSSACRRPACAPTATRSPARCCSSAPGATLDDPAWSRAPTTRLADELLVPSVIYAPAIAALLRHVDVRAVAHITGGGLPGNLAAGAARGRRRRRRPAHVGGAADLRRDPAPRRGRPTTRCARCSTSASAWSSWSPPTRCTARSTCSAPKATAPSQIGEIVSRPRPGAVRLARGR